jgi:membrane protein
MRAFVTDVIAIWNAERPTQLAAALAYYALFALAPIIVVAFSLAGLFIDSLATADRISERLAAVLGPQAVEAIRGALASSQSKPSSDGSVLASIIGFLALLYAASGLFYQLKYVLNRIWGVPYSSRGATARMIRAQLLAFLMVVGVALLLVALTVINVAVAWVGGFLQSLLGIADATLILALLASACMLAFSFSLLYKVLPDVRIRWRHTLPGAFAAAAMMVAAALLIGLFFKLTHAGTALAAAGSVAFVMVGINYLAQIFLLGAVVTRVYSDRSAARPPDATPDGPGTAGPVSLG